MKFCIHPGINKRTPSKGPSSYPDIGNLFIDPNEVKNLLDCLNPNKSSGPDDLSARVLKECSAEISPVLVFNQSLAQARVDWVARQGGSHLQEGENYYPANYRLVSLSYMCCKSGAHPRDQNYAAPFTS